jgi:DNA-binding NtrC family response regulator
MSRITDGSPALRLMREPTPTDGSRVLVAGRDATQRAAVLDQLTQTMPPSTVFEEAGAFCQVLERAPASRIVVLSGELDDVPAESLMQKLAHRHPGLPVVSLAALA